MRLFIAGLLPGEGVDFIEKHQAKFRDSLPSRHWRWTQPNQWHVTLKFLGETSSEILGDLKNECSKALAELRAPHLEMSRFGFFGRPRFPRVLWAGVEDRGERLMEIKRRLEKPLLELGFPKERRAFLPHVTLARRKEQLSAIEFRKFRAVLQDNPKPLGFDMRSFALFSSSLQSSGSQYRMIQKMDLSID